MARIKVFGGMALEVKDVSVFFDIVQRSILKGQAGDFVEKLSDLNIRKGLKLVTNFLTSGHIQADRALSSYLKGDTDYTFPPHEVFKGTMLGQWRHYKEGRAECINLFDSHLGAKQTRLLRTHLLSFLYGRSQREASLEVPVAHCVEHLTKVGASESQIVKCLAFLAKNGLLRTITADPLTKDSTITLSRSGGYHIHSLCTAFPYVEACLEDTAIEDHDAWQDLSELTINIERTRDLLPRMELRFNRIELFLEYLSKVEDAALTAMDHRDQIVAMPRIKKLALADASRALAGARKRYT